MQHFCLCSPISTKISLYPCSQIFYPLKLIFDHQNDTFKCFFSCEKTFKQKNMFSLFRQYNQRGLHYHYQGEGGEFSGVMILLRRGRSAAKCSSATHYSYHFYPLRKSPRFILCRHTYLFTHVNVFK